MSWPIYSCWATWVLCAQHILQTHRGSYSAPRNMRCQEIHATKRKPRKWWTPTNQASHSFTKQTWGSHAESLGRNLELHALFIKERGGTLQTQTSNMLLVANANMQLKAADDQTDMPTFPRLMWQKQSFMHHEISKSKVSDDSWDCKQLHCHWKTSQTKRSLRKLLAMLRFLGETLHDKLV